VCFDRNGVEIDATRARATVDVMAQALRRFTDPLAQSANTVLALDAANDLVELMRIAQSALRRAHNETYGEAHEVAAELSRHLHSMRQTAKSLRRAIEKQAADG